jgi:hypothetical protein
LKLGSHNQIVGSTLLILIILAYLILFSASESNAMVTSTSFNSTNNVNTSKSGETEICEDDKDPETCTIGTPSNNNGPENLLLIACFQNSCRPTNTSLTHVSNVTGKNNLILIGVSFKYSNETLQFIQKNKDQLQSLLSGYFNKAIDNITKGQIKTRTDCPNLPSPEILCDGIIVFKGGR